MRTSTSRAGVNLVLRLHTEGHPIAGSGAATVPKGLLIAGGEREGNWREVNGDGENITRGPVSEWVKVGKSNECGLGEHRQTWVKSGESTVWGQGGERVMVGRAVERDKGIKAQ